MHRVCRRFACAPLRPPMAPCRASGGEGVALVIPCSGCAVSGVERTHRRRVWKRKIRLHGDRSRGLVPGSVGPAPPGAPRSVRSRPKRRNRESRDRTRTPACGHRCGGYGGVGTKLGAAEAPTWSGGMELAGAHPRASKARRRAADGGLVLLRPLRAGARSGFPLPHGWAAAHVYVDVCRETCRAAPSIAPGRHHSAGVCRCGELRAHDWIATADPAQSRPELALVL